MTPTRGYMPPRQCPNPTGCRRVVRAGRLLCGPCWSLVPRDLQRAVNAAWRSFTATHSDEAWDVYARARLDALAALSRPE